MSSVYVLAATAFAPAILPAGASALSGYLGPLGMRLAVDFLSWLTWYPRVDEAAVRMSVRDAPLVRVPPMRNHSHPEAAAERTSALNTLVACVRGIGLEPFMVQMSAADVAAGHAGSREWYWAKDLAVPRKAFRLEPNQALVFVDVDYYIDMPRLLCDTFGNPVFIHTFQPVEVGGGGDNYAFTFLGDNRVRYRVSGGAVYEHRVYNYSTDVLAVESRRWGLYRYAVFHVERRQLEKHHALVILIPIAVVRVPLLPPSWVLGPANLATLAPAVGDHLRMDVMTSGGLMRSTGRVGSYASVTLPARDDDGVAVTAAMSTQKITPGQTLTLLKREDRIDAAILVDYHRVGDLGAAEYVAPVEGSVTPYQFKPHSAEFDFDDPVGGKAFASPILLGECFLPRLNLANDREAQEARLTRVAPNVDLTRDFVGWTEEWVRFRLGPMTDGNEGRLAPVDADEVYARRPRPAQRANLDAGLAVATVVGDGILESFQKKEPYPKPSPPRDIKTVPKTDIYVFASYMYPLHDWFMEYEEVRHTYAPGMTPLDIATNVARLASTADGLIMDDADKWDGRVSVVLRYKRQRLLLAAYPASHRERILEALRRSHHMRGRTTFGLLYDTYWAQLSGKEDTTVMNTDDHAYLDYCRWRKLGYSPADAYSRLGIYGGDDGVLVGTNLDGFEVFAQAGQLLECTVVKRGEVGVNFLNRWFGPGVWHGDLDSMTDVRRALAKFHVSCNMPPNVTGLRKLAEKAGNYALTDPNTPFLGELCCLIKIVLPPNGKYRELQTWYGREDASVQFPNEPGDWMEDLVEQWLPGLRYDLLRKWKREVRALPGIPYDPDRVVPGVERLMLGLPCCWEAPSQARPKEPAIVGDVLDEGTAPAPPSAGPPRKPLPQEPGSDAFVELEPRSAGPARAYQPPPVDKPCRWCKAAGLEPRNHWNAACPVMAAAGACGRCGKMDHTAPRCPKRKAKKQAGPR